MKMWRTPFDLAEKAIKPPKVVIDKERCKGCGYCAEFCARGSIEVPGDRVTPKGYSLPVFAHPENSYMMLSIPFASFMLFRYLYFIFSGHVIAGWSGASWSHMCFRGDIDDVRVYERALSEERGSIGHEEESSVRVRSEMRLRSGVPGTRREGVAPSPPRAAGGRWSRSA